MRVPRVVTERTGRFRPVRRSRVLERIARAGRYPIAVIAAPAGYGKTVALRQYLESIRGPVVRYDLRASESTLLGFIRGFAHAFAEFAPDLAKTVISAYESNHASPTCAADLAQWMHAHVKDFEGLVAIDDLHIAQDEPRVDEFLTRLIALTKEKASWLLASRGTGALPVASWIAYGDMEFVIDERDLRMTLDEAQSVANDLAPTVDETELKALLGATDAWPTALNFALRSSANVGDLREAASTSRDLLYRYLAEQVYRTLEPRQIELLQIVAHLQEIDIEVLMSAGFTKPEALLDELHKRSGFVWPERSGVYRCHDLFRDFLRFQAGLQGRETVLSLQRRCARALESAGHISSALEAYAKIASQPDILRLLRGHCFELLDHAHSDTVGFALDVIADDIREVEPVALGLLGLREVNAGHFRRAEALLSRAMTMASDPELSAEFGLRLGRVLFNQRLDAQHILEPIAQNPAVSMQNRIRALSFLAPSYAFAGEREKSLAALASLEEYASVCSLPSLLARVLHRAGIAALELGLPAERVRRLFMRAISISKKEGIYLTAAAAIGGLQSAARLREDETPALREYAEEAMAIALRSGDRLAIQTALLHGIDVESWVGNVDQVRSLVAQFEAAAGNDSALHAYLVVTRSFLHAWNAEFEAAYTVLASLDDAKLYDFDRTYALALRAISAAGCGYEGHTRELVASALESAKAIRSDYPYALLLVELTRALCAVAEAFSGRLSIARRILSVRAAINSPRAIAVSNCAVAICDLFAEAASVRQVEEQIARLNDMDVGGVGLLLRALLRSKFHSSKESSLTAAELEVLSALARGHSVKEIAAASSRSVHTVRTLSQRAIGKLGCRSRQQAICVAQDRGLIKNGR